MKQTLIKILIPFYKIYCNYRWAGKWKKYLQTHQEIKLIMGAASTNYAGWFPTDIQFVNDNEIQINVFDWDVTKPEDFANKLQGRKIQKVLAEHVLEHLSTEQIRLMLANFKKYGAPDMTIRVAVPDGLHTDQAYIEQVRPNGTGEGAHDHKHLFTYQSLSELFAKNGFDAHLVEYWDENRQFHQGYQNDTNGYIKRSFLNDSRNQQGTPVYTSLIIDFTPQWNEK